MVSAKMVTADKSAMTQSHTQRVLFYSHDTFGLGHLRRCRALAAKMTAENENITALIITGSTVAGRFTFPVRVDYVRVPGVTKRPDGTYTADKLSFDIEGISAVRSGLISALVKDFLPDVFIVDKEPAGFRGEILPALQWLRQRKQTRLVLGLRDVLDSPELLREEWDRKGAAQTIEKYYDEIWVYGLKSFYDPTQGLELPDVVRQRMHWTGYLRRESSDRFHGSRKPYILVTPGGGGDGEAMVDLVLQAYEKDQTLGPRAKIVYGPFLTGEVRAGFERRVAALKSRVSAVSFVSRMENLMAGATGVVAMGGYNTFCEILSCDVPAVIVPRTVPRLEQYIRASRAEELGLMSMLDIRHNSNSVDAMIEAIRKLPEQDAPSVSGSPDLLNGLDYVAQRTNALLPQATVKPVVAST